MIFGAEGEPPQLGPEDSRQTRSMMVSSFGGEVADFFSNKTQQPWSQSGPMPIIL